MAEVKPMNGNNWAYDGIGTVEAEEITTANQKLNPKEVRFDRRKISRKRFSASVVVDESSVRGMLADPKGALAKACQRALERQFDKVGIAAALADVQTGQDFETTVTASADGVLTVDATSGLTYAKLLEINENFINNEVGLDMPVKKSLLIAGKEHTALMGEEKLTSGDYSRDFNVEGGEIQKASGFDLIKYGRTATKQMLEEASVRKCLAIAEGGLHYGISKEVTVKVSELPDTAESVIIKVYFELGAVRTEGALIQQVSTTI